jgi:hypothetical protein
LQFSVILLHLKIVLVCCAAFNSQVLCSQGFNVSERTRDIESLHKIASDLLAQYIELLCLRAESASLLFPLKTSPRRRHNARRHRLATRALQRNEQLKTPILLVLPGR